MLFSGSSEGKYLCYYCGASCSDEFKSKDYVKKTFTNRDEVKYPGSKYVCKGCVDSMSYNYPLIKFIDGTVRENQRVLLYSWLITKGEKIAATKSHISMLRDVILNPPEPPFSIVLADSGKKQLIFRTPVSLSRENYVLRLEDDLIFVNTNTLRSMIDLAMPVIAAIGKVAIINEIGISQYIKVSEYFGNTEYLESWIVHKNKPIARLAAWLAPNQKEAQNVYPSIKRRIIPSETGGSNR